jgi:hypothetical protein
MATRRKKAMSAKTAVKKKKIPVGKFLPARVNPDGTVTFKVPSKKRASVKRKPAKRVKRVARKKNAKKKTAKRKR